MSGKMNWDRVRKETLARSHGSAWTPSVVELDRWKAQKRRKKGKKKRKGGQSLKAPANRQMPGCTCGKPIGFTGQHKRTCATYNPKSESQRSRINARSEVTVPSLDPRTITKSDSPNISLSDLVIQLNRVRLDSDLKNLLILWLKRLPKDAISSPVDKQSATELILMLQAEIAKYH